MSILEPRPPLPSDKAKQMACSFVDTIGKELAWVSHQIHARPELAFEESYAADLLTDTLRAHRMKVELGAHGMPTAFRATANRRGAPHIVVCCEYDAAPELGHAAGRNVVAAIGLGAGLALASLAADMGGSVTLLGTPAATRSGAGKRQLLESAAFTGADVALVAQVGPFDTEAAPTLANDVLQVGFFGTPTAAGAPWHGVNALDGLVLGYQALNHLRSLLPPDHQVFGIITAGGTDDDVVPGTASGRFRLRAPTTEQLHHLRRRVLDCFEGAARQTGTTLAYDWMGGSAELSASHPLAARYRANAEALGRTLVEPDRLTAIGASSTDMGDVSKLVGTIAPTVGFTGPPDGRVADLAILDGAKALAMTGLDVWTDTALLDEIRAGLPT
jgi:amidohydrolase